MESLRRGRVGRRGTLAAPRALTVALADPALAEDAAREAFARAYVYWRSVSAMERPAGWVYVVALRGGRRQRGRRVATVVPPVEPDMIDNLLERQSIEPMVAHMREAYGFELDIAHNALMGRCTEHLASPTRAFP